MYAVRFYGASKLEYVELPTPEPGPDDALIRVRAVGVCATDGELYRGEQVYYRKGMARYPIIPGHEWAGEIVGLGERASGFQIGDHVVGECSIGCGTCPTCRSGNYHRCPNRQETGVLHRPGGFAQYMAFPVASLHRVAPSVPFESACLIEPAAVAFSGVKRAEVTAGDSVLVIGAGPIGLLALQAARALGATKIMVVAKRKRRLEMAAQLGADEVVEYGLGSLPARAEEFTEGTMFTAVIEASGNPSAVEQIPTLVAPGGRVALLGLFAGERARLDLDELVVGEISVHGVLSSPNVWPTVIDLVDMGRLQTGPLVTHRMPLESAEAAMRLLDARDPSVVKIVLDVP